MDPTDVAQYATDFATTIARALGQPAPTGNLAALITAGQSLAAVANSAQATSNDWKNAWDAWVTARTQVGVQLRHYLGDQLPDIPGLQDLLAQTGWDSPEGLHGDVDLGPVHLSFASSSLVISPPPLSDAPALPPVPVGPFKPSSISATLQPPFGDSGGGLPGGGSIVRLPDGWGGTVQLPLGAVDVEADALLQRLPDGTPSFLAVLGVSFTPPIELSFGFSLDRVGGLVGVNRTVVPDALAAAIRSGTAGNILFGTKPPGSPAVVANQLALFFPPYSGHFIIGLTLRLSWLSFGQAGSLVSLDVGVIVELPTGRVVIPGVARVSIPGVEALMQLRVDVLGVIDPVQQLVSIDASLVDSHVLGVFVLTGDGAFRLCWGSQSYLVISLGGFYPGFDPEPAHLPALRRIGMAPDFPVPVPGISVRAEGYFAITTNTLQLGARIEVDFAAGVTAHGFVQVDALVQFRPFHFVANVSAGFDVGAFGFTFGGVRLEGTISGPGPLTIHGRFTIETFLHDFSFDKTFTIGGGSPDTQPRPKSLLAVVAEEAAKTANLRAERVDDSTVVLQPGAAPAGVALVPPAGTLLWRQRRAPLGLLIDRADGQPLGDPQGVTTTSGTPLTDQFSPGSYCNLTDSEALNRPPFDTLQSGVTLAPPEVPPARPHVDDRTVQVIVKLPAQPKPLLLIGAAVDLSTMAAMGDASRRPPALSDPTPAIVAGSEQWTTVGPGGRGNAYTSATAAHQSARQVGAVAVAAADADAAVNMAAV